MVAEMTKQNKIVTAHEVCMANKLWIKITVLAQN